MKHTLFTLSTLVAAAGLNAQTVQYDWNSSTQLADDFTTTDSAISQVTSGGLNNSGAISYSTSDVNGFSTVTGNLASFSTASDFTITQSTYFKTGTRTQYERDGRRAIHLGLTGAEGVAYAVTFVDAIALSGGLYVEDAFVAGSPNTLVVEFFGQTSDPDVNFSLTNNNLSINADSWYFLSVDYNYNSIDDEWSLDWSLNNSDSAGIVGSSVGTASSPVVANPFGANPNLHGFLGTRSAERTNIALLDNTTLVAVPEPSAFALIAGFLALGSIMVRRRR